MQSQLSAQSTMLFSHTRRNRFFVLFNHCHLVVEPKTFATVGILSTAWREAPPPGRV